MALVDFLGTHESFNVHPSMKIEMYLKRIRNHERTCSAIDTVFYFRLCLMHFPTMEKEYMEVRRLWRGVEVVTGG